MFLCVVYIYMLYNNICDIVFACGCGMWMWMCVPTQIIMSVHSTYTLVRPFQVFFSVVAFAVDRDGIERKSPF